MRKFVHLTDLHYGYERVGGHLIPLHDKKAMKVALEFVYDFKPDVVILGGDILDCGCIAHHNHGKPGKVEGMRLLKDAFDCNRDFIDPINAMCPNADKRYIIGNHEDWIQDLNDVVPGIEGIINVNTLLHLNDWKVIPQGEYTELGKLTYCHGDQIKGGEFCSKQAVIAFESNTRFGHHHTYQVYAKQSVKDYKQAKTGVAVPCLCTRKPHYGEGNPNRWQQGFGYGYVHSDGTFNDFVSIIVNGKTVANGKLYKA